MTSNALKTCFDFTFGQAIAKLQTAPNATSPHPNLPQCHFKQFSVSESAQLAHAWLSTLFGSEAELAELAQLLDELCSAEGRLVIAASYFYDRVA